MSEQRTIDLRGLQCPGPLVKLNEEIGDFDVGDEFVAIADDRAFELDIHAWCELTGNDLVSVDASSSDSIVASIRKT